MPVLIKNAVADNEGLMWTLLIIITAIASAYAVELSETEAEEVVETFLLRVTDERFDHRIRLMCEMHAIGHHKHKPVALHITFTRCSIATENRHHPP